jgi:hypothetical protein
MKRKLERVYRGRYLSPTEIANDAAARRKVQEEFPPSAMSKSSGALSDVLKQAIRSSDRTVYQIAHEAGVSQIVISRFLSGERDIRMHTADKLAGVLGLKLSVGP